MGNRRTFFLLSVFFLIIGVDSQASERRTSRLNCFDLSVNLKKNDSPYYMLSADASVAFIPNKFSLDIGAGWIRSTKNYGIYNEVSWNIGLKFYGDTLKKKIIKQFGLSFQHSKFKYNVQAYDIAVPSILVNAAIPHDVERNEFIMYFGLKYLMAKKMFIQASGGITYSGYRDIEHSSMFTYEKQLFRPVLQLYGCLGFGITL